MRETVKVSLFITCFNDTLFPQTGRAMVTLLERLGCEVAFPMAQTCCGQMHVNTGYQRAALPLIRHYVDTFEPHEVIVAPSGSCVGSISRWEPGRSMPSWDPTAPGNPPWPEPSWDTPRTR